MTSASGEQYMMTMYDLPGRDPPGLKLSSSRRTSLSEETCCTTETEEMDDLSLSLSSRCCSRSSFTGGISSNSSPSRSSILVVPTQADSTCYTNHGCLQAAARLRRRQRLQSRGVAFDGHKTKFSEVTVRLYPRILGDNPGGNTDGPPLSIDWVHESEKTWKKVGDYERKRDPFRRFGLEMRVSPHIRQEILEQYGYSRDDIESERCRVQAIRKQRYASIVNQETGVDYVREGFENVTKKFANVLSLGMSKRKERKFLKPYVSSTSSKSSSPSAQDVDNKAAASDNHCRRGSVEL